MPSLTCCLGSLARSLGSRRAASPLPARSPPRSPSRPLARPLAPARPRPLLPGPSGGRWGSPGGPMPAGCRADPRSAEPRPGACAGTQVSARGRGAENLSPRRPAAAETPPPAPARQPAAALPAPSSAPAPRGCSALPLPSCLSSLRSLPSPPASAAGGRDWDFLRSQGWGRGPLAAGGPGL